MAVPSKINRIEAEPEAENDCANDQMCRLLLLPPELRDLIYDFYGNGQRTAKLLAYNPPLTVMATSLNLERTCSQIRREVKSAFVSNIASQAKLIVCHIHDFDFSETLAYLQQLPRKQLAAMQSNNLLRVSIGLDTNGSYRKHIQSLKAWLSCVAGGETGLGRRFGSYRFLDAAYPECIIEQDFCTKVIAETHGETLVEWRRMAHHYNVAILEANPGSYRKTLNY